MQSACFSLVSVVLGRGSPLSPDSNFIIKVCAADWMLHTTPRMRTKSDELITKTESNGMQSAERPTGVKADAGSLPKLAVCNNQSSFA